MNIRALESFYLCKAPMRCYTCTDRFYIDEELSMWYEFSNGIAVVDNKVDTSKADRSGTFEEGLPI